ncbi:MAG: GNAT family N-acetyltransferase [Candidatus Zixiibacteriota bacterium]|nr:MAG: GNAT family N-acetyltransferase [candidate division Zixibacteria bacterium]
MSNIRKIGEKEIERFLELSSDAYPAFMIKSDDEREKIKKTFLEANKDPRYSIYGYFRDDKMLGQMRLFDFQMNFHGQKILAGGLGSVAVDLLHKKEKIAKEMVEFYYKYFYELGAPIAVLWPFRHDFYKQMGCGYGTNIYEYSVKPENLRNGKSKEHIRYLTKKDLPKLNDCYNRHVDKTHGMIEESILIRELRFERQKTSKYVGYVKDGKINGYMVISFTKGDADSFIHNNIIVEDLIYETPQALSEMLTYLHIQLDQINRVIFRTSNEYFFSQLSDPRNETMNMMPSVYHESARFGTGMMYRILNTQGIFKAMTKRNFNNQTIKIKFNVIDSFFPANEGSIILHFNQGNLSLENDGFYDVEIDIDVSELSSLVMGSVNFRAMYDFSLIKISDESFVDTINKLFAVEHKPICTTGF